MREASGYLPVEAGTERSWFRAVVDWLRVNGVWAYILGMAAVAAFQYFRDGAFSRGEMISQVLSGVLGLIFANLLALDRLPTVPDRVVKQRLRELFQYGDLPDVDLVYEALEGAGPNMEKFRQATDRYFLAGGDASEYRAWMARKLKV